MKQHKHIHTDFFAAQKIAYERLGFHYDFITPSAESREYGACTFTLNNKNIVFRVAKITPTKIGQFVTLWKRILDGPIMPYDITDPVDLFIVSVRNKNHFGQFIFPKDILLKKGFLSHNGKGGKRAMRVYPPWNITEISQAQKTQAWQLMYFVEFEPNLDEVKLKKFFLCS